MLADNPVRFIDAFVDELDLAATGFVRVEPKATGRPGLKLYIYGYLNRVRSSRRLEMECHRNTEVIWLLRSLKPDFKTIADFRRDNRVVFRSVFRTRVRDVRDALFGTVQYYERSERRELMRKAFRALAFNGISGDYLEFGSWGGMTFALAYKESRRANFRCKLWSFDSFRGLPPQASPEDEHRVWVEGSMSTGLEEFRAICRRNGISDDDYITVPSYYEDTIAQEDKIGLPLPNDVALACIDCDLYSSTKSVLRFLSSRMKHGMILALDDYYCYSLGRTPSLS